MSKASKVSHFHSTTFSAHRGRVDHATLGRPMATSSAAGAPGTVGAPMSPKFTAQAQCIAFLSPNETVQQYANRIAAGNIAAVGVRQLVLGGKLQIGIVEDLARKARKEATGSERGWGAVTAGQMFTAVNHQPPPAGMPIVTCGPGERAQLSWDQTSFGSGGGKGYSLQKRGTVTGVEDEPGTVGALTPKYKAQQQCVPFYNVMETMQQYADRVLGGNVGLLNDRYLMWGGKGGGDLSASLDSVAGFAMKASKKAFGTTRYWTIVRAGAVFDAAFNQPVPSGMPIGTCAKEALQQDQTSFGSGGGKGYSLQKRGTVTGVEDEPGTIGAPMFAPKFKPQAQCIAFLSPSETVQQYANRIAAGNIAAIGARQLWMTINGTDYKKIGRIADLAAKSRNATTGSARGWGVVTVGELCAAGTGFRSGPSTSFMTCAGASPESIDYYANASAVSGAEDEPGTVGLPADDLDAALKMKKNPYNGPMSPKFKAQAQCIAFLSPNETVQQYASRIAGGDVQKVGARVFMYGGKGSNMMIADLAAKARKTITGSSRGWASTTAGEMFWARTGQKAPAGMPLGSCDYGFGYGVNGAEDEPGTVGDLLDDAGDWVSTVVQESQNAFRVLHTETAAEQCAQMGPGWSWSADRNACANFEQEAAACAAAGNTWDDVAGQCRSNNCPPGSHSNPDLPGCIPDKIPCGAHSFQSGDKCLCEQGYEFKDMTTLDCVPVGQGWQSAIKKCGENTHTDPNVGGCVCDPGYIFDPKRTTADTLVCGKAECGSNSVFNQQDGQCHCKPGYDWVDPANIDNLDCKKVGNGGGGPVTPPAPKCGPGTHVDSATNTCVVDETKQNEPTKEEDNTWKWVAGIAAAAVVVGGGTYLAMNQKKGKKSALPNSSRHSIQTDVS